MTRSCPACNATLKRRGSQRIRVDPAMTPVAAPTGKRSDQPNCSDAAIQACLRMTGEGRPEILPLDGFQP